MKLAIALILVLAVYSSAQMPGPRWYKGNTHTHTLNSDGDSPPDVVVRWYRDHKYNFVFITDHEFITPAAPLNAEFAKSGEFLVVQGQEVTDSLNKKAYHLNALGVETVTMPKKGKTIVENYQQNIDAIRSIGGLPQINHPNYLWSSTATELAQLRNTALLEIFNGHPLVNSLGGGGVRSVEAMWDTLLSGGKMIWGVATDDSHSFTKLGDRTQALPGQGWIYVRALSLDPKSIMDALERGDFYASTGVELADYQATPKRITVNVRELQWSKYTTQFIGRNGRVLKTVHTNPAVYDISGNEGYVRAKVFESNGRMAWTQPVKLSRR